MNNKLPNNIVNHKAFLIPCTYLLVFFVCTLALFWVDSSKIVIVLIVAFSLVFTIYILQYISDKIQFIPIVFLMIWLLSTIFFFEFGPYSYPVENKNLLYFYLGGVHLALFIGYIRGAKVNILDPIKKYKVKGILNVFMIGSALFLLINLPNFISNISNIFSVIDGNIFAIRSTYVLTGGGGQWNDYISIFLYFFINSFLILTLYYWESINFPVRCFFIISLGFIFLSSVTIAGRSGTFNALIVITFSLIAAYFSGTIKKKNVRKYLLVSSLLFVFFFIYLNFISSARLPNGAFETHTPLPVGKMNEHSIFFQVIPEFFYPVVFSGIQYISHGYYGLSLSLEKPFIGITFGTGQSMFLARNFARVFNFDISYLSYPSRVALENNFPYVDMTAYPGIASDVTFIGSIFVIFILGYLLALAWKDILIKHNPFAVVVFVTFSTIIVFLPMHSVIQDGNGIVNFFMALILWWFKREKVYE